MKKQRYTLQSWVCDYGIYDNVQKKFIGQPIESYKEAKIIYQWFLKSLIKYEKLQMNTICLN